MLAEYLPTLLFLIVATGIGIALIVIGNVLGPKRPSAEKRAPYECGFPAFEDARMQLGVFGLVEMGVFLSLLVIGFVYVWKKGALEWE